MFIKGSEASFTLQETDGFIRALKLTDRMFFARPFNGSSIFFLSASQELYSQSEICFNISTQGHLQISLAHIMGCPPPFRSEVSFQNFIHLIFWWIYTNNTTWYCPGIFCNIFNLYQAQQRLHSLNVDFWVLKLSNNRQKKCFIYKLFKENIRNNLLIKIPPQVCRITQFVMRNVEPDIWKLHFVESAETSVTPTNWNTEGWHRCFTLYLSLLVWGTCSPLH